MDIPENPIQEEKRNKKWWIVFFVGIGVVFLLLVVGSILLFNKGKTSEKNVTTSSKTYSLVTQSQDTSLQLSPNDVLTGSGIPEGTVVLVLSPGNKTKTVTVTEKGTWKYQLPKDIKSGKYYLSATILDAIDQIAGIKTYQIKINKPVGFLPSFIEQTYAQNTSYDWERYVGSDWESWLDAWHQAGWYPAWEHGVVIYYSKEAYAAKYCPEDHSCVVPEYSLNQWLQQVRNNDRFLINLIEKVRENCYDAKSLLEYFPNLFTSGTARRNNRVRAYASDFLAVTCYKPFSDPKNEIGEDTLTQYIREVLINTQYQERDIFKLILNTAGPYTGSRAMYNIVTQYEQTNGVDYVDATLGLLSFIPEAKVLGSVGAKAAILSVNRAQMIADMAFFRRAIKEDGFIAADTIAQRQASWFSSKPKTPVQPVRPVRPQPPRRIPNSLGVVEPKDSNALWYFDRDVLPAFQSGKGSFYPADDLIDAVRSVSDAIIQFKNRTGRPFIMGTPHLNDLVKHNTVYIIPDEYLVWGGEQIGGYAIGDMIVMIRSAYRNSKDKDFVIRHELTHIMGAQREGFARGKDTLNDKTFTVLYELGTDAWADLALGGTGNIYRGFYAQHNPNLARILSERLFRNDPIFKDDLLEFARIGDAHALARGYVLRNNISKPPGELFINTFVRHLRERNGLDFAAITYVGANIADEKIFVDPVFELNPKMILPLPDDVSPYKVTLLGMNPSPLVSGDDVILSTAISQEGIMVGDTAGLSTAVIMTPSTDPQVKITDGKKISPLPGSVDCFSYCTVTLPRFSPKTYTLTLYLMKKDTREVLDSDATTVTVIASSGNERETSSIDTDYLKTTGGNRPLCTGKITAVCKGEPKNTLQASWNLSNQYGDCNIYIRDSKGDHRISSSCSSNTFLTGVWSGTSIPGSGPVSDDGHYQLFISNGGDCSDVIADDEILACTRPTPTSSGGKPLELRGVEVTPGTRN